MLSLVINKVAISSLISLVVLLIMLCSIYRVVSLLQNGAIMNKVFQPHEAHIPYMLQVM